ncbi:MAG: type II toxin-antitoxin system HicA family toxin [Clostridiales bacterium]|nr:type II toxin-antitoxin system HicA family toxin [Clostridiales bacterium]
MIEIYVFYLHDLIDTIYGVVYNHKNNIGRYCYDKMAEIIETTTSLRFEQLAKILEEHGYSASETSSGSSHITFRKKGRQPITVPRHIPIKKAYIEIIRNAIKDETNNN